MLPFYNEAYVYLKQRISIIYNDEILEAFFTKSSIT